MPSDEDMMCGNGTVCQWRKALNGNKPGREKDEDRGKRHSWSKSGRGRHGERRRRRGRRWLLNGNHQQQHHPHPRRRVEQQQQAKPLDAVVVSSLRPVNIKGNRARGMRAPRNTNQFLMHEKYQLMHMRSDSIGTDASGSGSDSDAAEFILTTDMDSYLGALENARGALLDGAAAPVSRPPPTTTTPPLVLDSCLGGALLDAAAAPDSRPPPTTTTPLLVLGSCLGGGALLDAARAPDSRPPPTPLLVWSRQQQVFHHQEDSMQYFPSEDDVIQSEDFMQKDFIDFCGTLTEHV